MSTHPEYDISSYVAVIRSKTPGPVGQAIAEAIQKTHDAVGAAFNQFSALFQVGQTQDYSADSLAIRNVTKRFTFADAPDIQNVPAATYQIVVLGDWVRLNNTSGGAVTLTSAPTIADGKNGQCVELLNVSANNIIFQDQGTLAGSNLRLSANTITIATRSSLLLRFSSEIGDWVQRVPNVL